MQSLVIAEFTKMQIYQVAQSSTLTINVLAISILLIELSSLSQTRMNISVEN